MLTAPWSRHVIATVHPSSVLRAPDDEQRRAARLAFFADVAVVGECYRSIPCTPDTPPAVSGI